MQLIKSARSTQHARSWPSHPGKIHPSIISRYTNHRTNSTHARQPRLPVLMRETVTTPPCTGLTSLDTSGCSATTAMAAATTASCVLCGMPAWPPTPCMLIRNRSEAAKVGPACRQQQGSSSRAAGQQVGRE